MTPDVTPLVLLVLLTFFFIVALAFTVWAALTVGDAARRTQQSQADDAARRALRSPAREPKPWERKPEPRSPEPARQQRGAVQETLWERRPEPKAVPARSEANATTDQHGGRAVVTPRQPNTDAFERFLESEKRRD